MDQEACVDVESKHVMRLYAGTLESDKETTLVANWKCFCQLTS